MADIHLFVSSVDLDLIVRCGAVLFLRNGLHSLRWHESSIIIWEKKDNCSIFRHDCDDFTCPFMCICAYISANDCSSFLIVSSHHYIYLFAICAQTSKNGNNFFLFKNTTIRTNWFVELNKKENWLCWGKMKWKCHHHHHIYMSTIWLCIVSNAGNIHICSFLIHLSFFFSSIIVVCDCGLRSEYNSSSSSFFARALLLPISSCSFRFVFLIDG